MNSLIKTLSEYLRDASLARLFLDTAIKSIVILALAGSLCLLWRRASAAARHWIWFLAMASLPCLPLLSIVLPAWQKPLWSVASEVNSANRISLTVELAPRDRAEAASREAALFGVPSLASREYPSAGRQTAAGFSANWLAFAVGIWFAGVAFLLIRNVVGQWVLRKTSRRTRRLCGGDWSLLLEDVCRVLRLRRPVTLLESPEKVMPLTWGWWRPAVLLPVDAEQWPAERKRIVLLHELAHVKRRDCLTHLITRMVCALYWFNPLVWIADRRMCVERERACDDLVLDGGCRASEYASQLVEVARMFRVVRQPVGAIALARSPQLQERIAAIVDATRRRHFSGWVLIGLTLAAAGFVTAIAAQKPEGAEKKPWFDARLRAFFTAKAQQARSLAAREQKELAPEVWPFFDAGIAGDFTTATNLYAAMRKRAYQYEHTTRDERMETLVWQPINEAFGAWQEFANWEEKYILAYGEDIIKSIPPGSIYFGGTDPGRWVITAMSESHAEGKPFFTISQNPLADDLYEQYVRIMYGSKISTTTTNDVQDAFTEYTANAAQRLAENKLKPGENVTEVAGKVQVSGQVAVMAINGLIARKIFDKNPDREFYVEESFPLDWMYPHLEPHGLIMKINRQPLSGLSDEVRKDHEYWSTYLKPMIGGWLGYDTPVAEVTAFAEKVYLRHDLSGFQGDPRFAADGWAQRAYSKLRSSIGGVYAWRADHASGASEKARMVREADFAFRQAYALCPYSPEAVYRYVQLLVNEKRVPEAILIAETAGKMPQTPDSASAKDQLRQLAEHLKTLPEAK